MATEKTSGTDEVRLESADPNINHLQEVDIRDKGLNNANLEATAQEHKVGVWEGFMTYKRAAFWSIRKKSSYG
jgi:SP family general alpha glucoside:H+ symporter-like MFS transporter